MENLEDASTRDLLKILPPVDQAPILEKLATLGLRRFRKEYAVDTPVNPETGIVDHEALIRLVGSFVLDSYQWKAPFFDEHHLHWYKNLYANHKTNPALALEFRNQATNKIWIPRQWHDTAHVLTLPSKVPEYEVMRDAVKDFRRKNYLYTIATSAIELRERSLRMKQYESKGDVMYIDPVTKRVTHDEGSYNRRREDFIHVIERHHRKGLLDLSELSSIDLRDASSIEAALPEIQEYVGSAIVRVKGHTARKVDLLIDRPDILEPAA